MAQPGREVAVSCGQIIAVLLPDGCWYEIEPGSYRSWSRTTAGEGTDGRFTFRQHGEVIGGPLSSILATRESGCTCQGSPVVANRASRALL